MFYHMLFYQVIDQDNQSYAGLAPWEQGNVLPSPFKQFIRPISDESMPGLLRCGPSEPGDNAHARDSIERIDGIAIRADAMSSPGSDRGYTRAR